MGLTYWKNAPNDKIVKGDVIKAFIVKNDLFMINAFLICMIEN